MRIFEHLGNLNDSSMGLIKDIHVSPVINVERKDKLRKAISIMQEHGFKHLQVKEGDLVTGSISERKRFKAVSEGEEPERFVKKTGPKILEQSFPMVSDSTPVLWVIPLLQNFQALLTTLYGKVSGIVTSADLIKIISGTDLRPIR